MSYRIDKEFYRQIVYDIAAKSEQIQRIIQRKVERAESKYKDKVYEITSMSWLKKHRGVLGYVDDVKDLNLNYETIAYEIGKRSLYYCPIDTGKLKSSFSIKNLTYKDEDDTLWEAYSVKYDGHIAPYAVYVHALVDKWHIPPTRAKFLEDAALDVINANKTKWLRKKFYIAIYMMYNAFGSVGCVVADWNQDIDSISDDNKAYLLYSNVDILRGREEEKERREEEKERRREERKQEAKRLREKRKYLSTLDDEAAKLRELMKSSEV